MLQNNTGSVLGLCKTPKFLPSQHLASSCLKRSFFTRAKKLMTVCRGSEVSDMWCCDLHGPSPFLSQPGRNPEDGDGRQEIRLAGYGARAFKPMPSALTVPLLVSPDNHQYAQGAVQTHIEAGIWARHLQISTNVVLKVQQPRKRVLHSLHSINLKLQEPPEPPT